MYTVNEQKFLAKRWLPLLVLGGSLINVLLSLGNDFLESPIFMDSMGTAVCAALGGMVPGIVTGILTNGVLDIIHGLNGDYFPFAICNALTGFIIGFMVHKGWFNTVLHMTVATLITAFVNTLIGGLLAAFIYNGTTGIGVDYLVISLSQGELPTRFAAILVRIPVNVIDKLIAVQTAFWIRRAISRLK